MMLNWKKNLIVPAILVLALALTIGCGGNDDGAATAEKAEKAADATVVAVHDCEGDCGMKGVAVDEMTVVDGKHLCAACAKKAEGAEHPSGGTDHPK